MSGNVGDLILFKKSMPATMWRLDKGKSGTSEIG